MDVAIWWVRRDLRLNDNQALKAALQAAVRVIPVFVLDTKLAASAWVGERRLGFLLASLRALDADLRARGAGLIVRKGKPQEVLTRLFRDTGAEAIFAEADFSPYARQRDKRVAKALPLHLTPGLTLISPEVIHKSDGSPYKIYTPFSQAWLTQLSPGKPLPAPEHITAVAGLASEHMWETPAHNLADKFPVGESEAQHRLDLFTHSSIYSYSDLRDHLDQNGTSKLSAYLRFGTLSMRQVVLAAQEAEVLATDHNSKASVQTWLRELIWREFYFYILYHFPYVRRQSFREQFCNIRWLNRESDFIAWAKGRTGIPVVDAAMRQLVQTGWMHNRARMIVASFLAKDLLVDWRWGERYFMQHLIDGDPAANNGGWQWTAGTGTDAAPYFRIFNPVTQGKRFDPEGEYVRRYVPELTHVPNKYIHMPWTMPVSMQQQCQCKIGLDYPLPLIDHSVARQRALAAYRMV